VITEIKADVCYPLIGWGDYSTVKGKGSIKVEWQIYSRLNREVVHRVTTFGASQISASDDAEAYDILLGAFAQATHNLLADQGFHNLVMGHVEKKDAQIADSSIVIRSPVVSKKSIQNKLNDIRAATVVINAGEGHGSGAIVGSDEYVLTNVHVVRGAKFVKVGIATGREILGEVIRINKRRDVALVKVEEKNLPAIAIEFSEPAIGHDVYAIGAPLEGSLSTTVSKGIVSAYRDRDGLKHIQSDVNIQLGSSGGPLLNQNGNLVGIAQSGIVFDGASTGLNFFIPIRDALRFLNIQLKYQN